MVFQNGEQVGPYTIIEQLGRGGMATVYKAYHASLDRYVALKVLHPAFMEDPNFLARFEREAKVVANLEHPNIIPVYDYAHHNSEPYLVMKYVEGETLKARIKKGNLTPDEGLRIIEEVGKGLSFAHRQGILHRDIKPSNVMLTADDRIYLADFGLARIATSGESTMSGDMMLGTPQYISPEQAMGKSDLDEGADIYSFGVMIYELVVGQVPYSADTPFSIVHDHIYKALPLPRTTNPNVPESVERVLLKALAKERDDRFETVKDLVSAFKRAIDGEKMPDEWSASNLAGGEETLRVAESTQMTNGTPEILTNEDSITDSEVKRRKRSRWKRFFIGIVGVFLFFVCTLTAISVLSGGQDERRQVAMQETQEAADLATEEASGGLSPEELEFNRIITEAEDRIANDPENAGLYLDLALAYLDAGKQDAALEAFERGEVVADGDPDFYNLAGDMLAGRELWFAALQEYSTAVENGFEYQDNTAFLTKFYKALYNAAEDPEVYGLIFDQINDDGNELLTAQVLVATRARYILTVEDDPDRAAELMLRIAGSTRTSVYADLINAEILLAQENYGAAEELIDSILLDESNGAEWLRIEARHLKAELP